MANKKTSPSPRSLFFPLVVLATSVFLWIAMLTYSAGDWPSPNQFPHNDPTLNACGTIGSWFAYNLLHLVGDGTYCGLLFITLASLLKLTRGSIGSTIERCFGVALVTACLAASSHLITRGGVSDLPVGRGGLIGYAFGELLTGHMDKIGTIIVLVASFVVGAIFATQGWVFKLPILLRQTGQVSFKAWRVARAGVVAARNARVNAVTSAERSALLGPKRSAGQTANLEDQQSDNYDACEDEAGKQLEVESDAVDVIEVAEEEALKEVNTPSKLTTSARKKLLQVLAGKKQNKRPTGPKVNFPTREENAQAYAYPRKIENWTLPPLDLLEEPEYGFSAQQEAFVREQAKVLERTLEEFRIDARVVEIDTGPVITMFELKLGAGIKVAQISALANDCARALKAHAIRVVAPISGKNTVGIEVPNANKEKVRLKELMTVAGQKAKDMALPLFLGKDAGGAALVTDLAKMPHMLIAGTTGSGKSVCLNSVVLSLLMAKRPDHVKLIIIDPKMVEMTQFKEVPHLMSPIITDMLKAEKILEWAVVKMEERYAILAEARVKNIASYNALGAEKLYERFAPTNEAEKSRIVIHLPYVVIIIDELADLMMMSAKEVEHHLARLAQKSRAVGIHIIVATQRPEAKVVTGLIKSNLPSRICFRVASRMDSRIVLDQNGGEVLLGQGDMLFLPPGSHKLIRAQGTLLEDDEIQRVLDDLNARAKPEFHPELMRIKDPRTEGNISERDPLFEDAVRVVLESSRGSVSLLQRRLTIGYSRASRLIDQMADAGIVGEYKGSQAREVMMSVDEWQALHAQVQADLEQGYEADEDQEDTSEEAEAANDDSCEEEEDGGEEEVKCEYDEEDEDVADEEEEEATTVTDNHD